MQRRKNTQDMLASRQPEPPKSANPPRKKQSTSTPDYTHLPFAVPVPGRVGYVTLQGRNDLPEIDVRGIAPGTPVEIPDPTNTGRTIQFRVP